MATVFKHLRILIKYSVYSAKKIAEQCPETHTPTKTDFNFFEFLI